MTHPAIAHRLLHGNSLPPVSLLRHCASLSPGLVRLAPKVRDFVQDKAKLCQPDRVHLCDGSEAEATQLLQTMQQQGIAEKVSGKYENWYVHSEWMHDHRSDN